MRPHEEIAWASSKFVYKLCPRPPYCRLSGSVHPQLTHDHDMFCSGLVWSLTFCWACKAVLRKWRRACPYHSAVTEESLQGLHCLQLQMQPLFYLYFPQYFVWRPLASLYTRPTLLGAWWVDLWTCWRVLAQSKSRTVRRGFHVGTVLEKVLEVVESVSKGSRCISWYLYIYWYLEDVLSAGIHIAKWWCQCRYCSIAST